MQDAKMKAFATIVFLLAALSLYPTDARRRTSW